MHKLISKEYQEILNVYSKNLPTFLLPFFEAESIIRLSDISQNCGTEHCKFYNYHFKISRLEHSLGVATIIWNFTKDKKQTLAGFFHDISHSVFSHVGDFVLGDGLNQEASEQHTSWILKNDQTIVKELKNIGIKQEEVENYEIYPIADNSGPKLAADRLEYTLSNGLAIAEKNIEEIKKIYENIIILKNEDQIIELGFNNIKEAEKLGLLSIFNDETCFSSYESIVAMSFLSEIIKKLLENKLVTNMELYTIKDNDLIKIIENSNNIKIQNMWDFYKNLGEYKIDRVKPITDKYITSSECKKRYIDPLIKIDNSNIRLSSLSENFIERKNYHINRKEEWITLNIEI